MTYNNKTHQWKHGDTGITKPALTCNAPPTGTDESAASGLRLAWRLCATLLSTNEDHGDCAADTGWNKTGCEDAGWLLDLSTCQQTLNKTQQMHISVHMKVKQKDDF